MFDGEYRIAQYGQWDHYPSGQGLTALEFCRKWLRDPVSESRFVSNMLACRWITEEECDAALDHIGCPSGSMTRKQAEKFHNTFPLLTRDLGAEVLQAIAADGGGLLENQINFAGNSLFCEYAYVVDLDNRTFEVFKGFNQHPLQEGERFANLAPKDDYYPVRLLALFSLDDLPTKSEFLKATQRADEEDQ
ncbi:MAG: hypothetical protein ACTHU0_00205 [Kofleriaceae bacterium]